MPMSMDQVHAVVRGGHGYDSRSALPVMGYHPVTLPLEPETTGLPPTHLGDPHVQQPLQQPPAHMLDYQQHCVSTSTALPFQVIRFVS